MTTATHLENYTDAIKALPEEAFLGALLYFSITQADVHLESMRTELIKRNLDPSSLPKTLRPVDAFRKATRDLSHKFDVNNGIRSELMVRSVGEDAEHSYRHLILERAEVKSGKRRRLMYEKVGEIVLHRGFKKEGAYHSHRVEIRRMTDHLVLTTEEDTYLTESLAKFPSAYDHYLEYLDSHGVRTFVREYIYNLSGTCVRESGGIYFVKHSHNAELEELGKWVQSVGSSFHSLPLLNLAEQRGMIMQAFEDETVQEVERLMAEVASILSEPNRKIAEKTFDAYAGRVAELTAKVQEYDSMLGSRAEKAVLEINAFKMQVLNLSSRIRDTKSMRAKEA